MKTRQFRYYALFVSGLFIMEVAGVRLLWVRQQQRQQTLTQQKPPRTQQRQKAKQVQPSKTVVLEGLQDNFKIQHHLCDQAALNSMLLDATAKGQLDRAKQLIKCGADVHWEGHDNWEDSPLLCAIKGHHTRMVCLLLEQGAQCNSRTAGTTPLICAAEQGDNVIVKQLLTHGADVNDRVKRGTALTFAAEAGHLDVVRTLVQAGAEINTCYYEDSVLYDAVSSGNTAVVASLLEHGANVNITNDGKCTHDETPLTHAAETGDCAMLRLLLRNGAEVNQCSKFDGSSLTIAVAHKHRNAVALLLKHGAKVKVTGSLEEYHRSKGDAEEWYQERRVYDARTYTRDPKLLRMLNQSQRSLHHYRAR